MVSIWRQMVSQRNGIPKFGMDVPDYHRVGNTKNTAVGKCMGEFKTRKIELLQGYTHGAANEHFCSYISQEMNDWNVSRISDFAELFNKNIKFDEDISNWDVSSGGNFTSMFRRAASFNQDLSSWDVSSGTSFVSAVVTWTSCASSVGLFNPWLASKFSQLDLS